MPVTMSVHSQKLNDPMVQYFPKTEKCHEFATLDINFNDFSSKGRIELFVNKDSLDSLLLFATKIQQQVLHYQAKIYEEQLEEAVNELTSVLVPTDGEVHYFPTSTSIGGEIAEANDA